MVSDEDIKRTFRRWQASQARLVLDDDMALHDASDMPPRGHGRVHSGMNERWTWASYISPMLFMSHAWPEPCGLSNAGARINLLGGRVRTRTTSDPLFYSLSSPVCILA